MERPWLYPHNFEKIAGGLEVFDPELAESQGMAAERPLPADAVGDGGLLAPLRGPTIGRLLWNHSTNRSW